MWQLLARLARQLPAEAAHQLAVETLRWQLGPRPTIEFGRIDPTVILGGVTFPNPIGLAAGFDKNAACYQGALRLGFGHVEVGTITPLPQSGSGLSCRSTRHRLGICYRLCSRCQPGKPPGTRPDDWLCGQLLSRYGAAKKNIPLAK